MALTLSENTLLGQPAPDFTLPNVIDGRTVSLPNDATAVVIMFICNHCPYVQHIQTGLMALVHRYTAQGVKFIAISSNDASEYPSDSPEAMAKLAQHYNYTFPYLYDETQQVARAYQAVCTPEFYVLDSKNHCVYHGRFDDATPGNGQPVTGADLSANLDALLSKQPLPSEATPALGCSIKWMTASHRDTQ